MCVHVRACACMCVRACVIGRYDTRMLEGDGEAGREGDTDIKAERERRVSTHARSHLERRGAGEPAAALHRR
jgi:hypothetical protein